MFHSRFQSGVAVDGCFATNGNKFEKKFLGKGRKRGSILFVNLRGLISFNTGEIEGSTVAQ